VRDLREPGGPTVRSHELEAHDFADLEFATGDEHAARGKVQHAKCVASASPSWQSCGEIFRVVDALRGARPLELQTAKMHRIGIDAIRQAAVAALSATKRAQRLAVGGLGLVAADRRLRQMRKNRRQPLWTRSSRENEWARTVRRLQGPASRIESKHAGKRVLGCHPECLVRDDLGGRA